eukprot:3926652-Prorocentrum_lima.AAC.1
MTSSLVGSEMCIRDSNNINNDNKDDNNNDNHPQTTHRAESGQRREGPVSYTHLTLPTICSV